MALDLPTLFFVVAALTLLMAFWVAVRRSQGHRLMGQWWVLLPTLLLRLRLPLALLPLMDDYRSRIMRVTLTFAAQSAAVLWALRDRLHPHHGRGRYILLSSFAFLELALLQRFASVSLGWVYASSPTDGNQWQALMFLASSCAVISIALGFVYMEFERIEQQSLTLAMNDMLTGLSNRRAISEALQVAVVRAQRHGQSLSVLLLDIDHFKRVNASFGHTADAARYRAEQGGRNRVELIAPMPMVPVVPAA